MCEYCFTEQFESFESSKDFQEFDFTLTKKLSKDVLVFRKNETLNYGGVGYYIYRCNFCNTDWYLSEPDNAWRGFFLPKNQAKKTLNSLQTKERRVRWGCLLISIVMVVIFILLWLN